MTQHIDLIYFWSSLVLVALPVGIFSWMTWLLVKRYRHEMREKGEGH